MHGSARTSAAVAVGVALAYLGLAQYVLWLNDPVPTAAYFWPAAGISVAALLLLPVRHWWMVVAGLFVAELGSDLVRGFPLLASCCWALANAVEPVIGATLVRRLGGCRERVVPARKLIAFLACAAVVAPAIGGAVGALGAVQAFDAEWSRVWVTWLVGDGLGVLVMAPPLLVWRYSSPVSRSRAEAAALALAVLVGAVLGYREWYEDWDVLLPYLTMPALVWAALRFGLRGAALAGLATAHVAVLATALGPGALAPASASGVAGMTLLQVVLAITVGTGLLLAALASDLREREEVERLLGHRAVHDDLTGLPNRVLLHEQLAAVLDRARPGRSAAVLFLDLDRFKAVNDSLGHGWGDVLLVETAARLRAAARPRDLVARLGGDEFVVVCPDLETAAGAGPVAQRLLQAVCRPVTHEGRTVTVSTSIGVATVSEPGTSPADVLRDADQAMYRAKRAGRNRVHVWEEGESAAGPERLELAADPQQPSPEPVCGCPAAPSSAAVSSG